MHPGLERAGPPSARNRARQSVWIPVRTLPIAAAIGDRLGALHDQRAAGAMLAWMLTQGAGGPRIEPCPTARCRATIDRSEAPASDFESTLPAGRAFDVGRRKIGVLALGGHRGFLTRTEYAARCPSVSRSPNGDSRGVALDRDCRQRLRALHGRSGSPRCESRKRGTGTNAPVWTSAVTDRGAAEGSIGAAPLEKGRFRAAASPEPVLEARPLRSGKPLAPVLTAPLLAARGRRPYLPGAGDLRSV